MGQFINKPTKIILDADNILIRHFGEHYYLGFFFCKKFHFIGIRKSIEAGAFKNTFTKEKAEKELNILQNDLKEVYLKKETLKDWEFRSTFHLMHFIPRGHINQSDINLEKMYENFDLNYDSTIIELTYS